MISQKELTNLINKLNQLSSLAEEYKLKDILLFQPLILDKEKLHFSIIPRENQKMSLVDLSMIKIALDKLLESNKNNECLIVDFDFKNTFKEEFLNDQYKESLSLLKSNKEEVTSFIKNILKFNYNDDSHDFKDDGSEVNNKRKNPLP